MQENALIEPAQLADDELDLVTGGAVVTGGLVNVTLTGTNVDILNGLNLLNNNNVPITIRNVANNNDVSVGAIIQLLGGGAAILQHQA
jgi:hypothetical protein